MAQPRIAKSSTAPDGQGGRHVPLSSYSTHGFVVEPQFTEHPAAVRPDTA
jgi:hypothetical protein